MGRLSKEDGFTILELLLVLSIVSILTLAVIPIGGKWMKTVSYEKALDMFITNIHSMQSYSLANQDMSSVVVVPINGKKGAYYDVLIGGNQLVAQIHFPKGMRWSDSNGSLLRINFHPDGDIRTPGTMTLLTDYKTYRLTFQLVKGRVIIYESDRPIVARNDFDPSRTRGHLWYTFATRNENDYDFA